MVKMNAGAQEGIFLSAQGAQPLSGLMSDDPGSLQHLLPVMVAVLEAVMAAQRMCRHCNLDPRSILLQEDGTIHISCVSEHDKNNTLDLGLFKYSSPELLQGDASVQPALTHSYVLGFVFYELLLGRRMFDAQFHAPGRGESGGWLIWHTDRKRRARPLSELRVDIPAFVSSAIEKMMAKDPGDRSGDLEGVARLFERVNRSTAAYKILRDQGSASTKPSKADRIRPRLIWLGGQPWWKTLWRYVTPEDPRPGQASIQGLERMLRQMEKIIGHVGSRLRLLRRKKTSPPPEPGWDLGVKQGGPDSWILS